MQILDVNQAAARLNVSRRTIYRMVEDGQLVRYKIRGKVGFSDEDIDAFIASCRQEHVEKVKIVVSTKRVPLPVPSDCGYVPGMKVCG